jgi:nucleotide-binding universal stress UspA family protein
VRVAAQIPRHHATREREHEEITNPPGPELALTSDMWTRILLPHDLSDCAARALDVAAELARAPGASLVLVHVSAMPPGLPPDTLVTATGHGAFIRVDDLATDGAHRELEAVAARLRGRGLDVTTLALAAHDDDVAAAILRVAAEQHADVVVMGTHGRSGLARFLTGSVAEEVMRTASIPLVTVRTPVMDAAPTPEEATAEDELAG